MAVIAKIQELLDQAAAVKQKMLAMNYKINQANVRELLAWTTHKYMTDIDYTVYAFDDTVQNDSYPIPLRTYVPDITKALPVAVFLHGGGHVAGSISVYDGIARKLARRTGHIIVAVEYRLAPEFPYPTGLMDSKAVIGEVFKVLAARKIQYENAGGLTIIGDSAGGALCASILMDKQFVAANSITRQVLIYPAVDYTLSSPSMNKFASGYLLEKARVQFYFSNYFQNGEDLKQVSPLYNEFYATMPKTLIIVAEYDPLVDEGSLYHESMLKAGASSELITIPGAIHAYLMLENLCRAECDMTYREISHFLNGN